MTPFQGRIFRSTDITTVRLVTLRVRDAQTSVVRGENNQCVFIFSSSLQCVHNLLYLQVQDAIHIQVRGRRAAGDGIAINRGRRSMR